MVERLLKPAPVALCVLALIARAVTAPLQGQEPAPKSQRSGFWASGGAGYVTLTAGCSTCGDRTYRPGLALYARAGGTPSPAVRIGGELASLRRSAEASDVRLFFATLMAQWHPVVTSGFYLHFGYGLANGRQDYTTGDMTIRTSSTGIGIVLGTGWEFPIGRIAIMPFASMYAGALGDIEARDATGTPLLLMDAIGTGYQIGLSITSP